MYLFPSQEANRLDLCKAPWPLTRLLEVHTADHCSLPRLSSQSTANKSIPLFCIPCKNLNSTVQWRRKFKWGRVKWPNRPVAVWTRLSRGRALGLSGLHACFGDGICSVYMNKRTCLQRNAAWLRCEQARQLWQWGSKKASSQFVNNM